VSFPDSFLQTTPKIDFREMIAPLLAFYGRYVI
jgi:hypothetical protein